MKKSRLDDVLRRNQKHPIRDIALTAAMILGLALVALVVVTKLQSPTPRAERPVATGAAFSPGGVAGLLDLAPEPHVALR